MPEVSWLGVIVATVASFAIGSVWYSPLLFTKVWQREAGISDDKAKNANMAMIFGTAFVLQLLAAFVFALFLGPRPGLAFGLGAGFSAGLFWVAGALGVNYLFEQRSLKLWLINGGYNVVTFTAFGAILGVL
jgi:hypothetical protein